MSKSFYVGIILLVAGLVVALRPASYRTKEAEIGIGDARVQVEERHAVPGWLGWTGAGAGLILMVNGLRLRGNGRVVRDHTPHTTP